MRYAFFFGLALGMVGIVPSVEAGDGDGDNATADEAFKNGSAYYNQSQFKEALDEFNKAYKLKPAWKILYNIGQCSASLKEWGAALDAFRSYLSAGLDEIDLERRRQVEQDIDSFKKLVGYLKVTAPKGVNIYVNGIYRGSAPIIGQLAVNGGQALRVSAEFDGKVEIQTIEITNEQSGAVDFSASLQSKPIQVTAHRAPPAETPYASQATFQNSDDLPILKIAGVITVGIGAATLVGGAIVGGISLGIHTDIEKSCDTDICFSEDADRVNRMNNLATSGTVLLAVGGVTAATGLGLLIYRWIAVKKQESPSVTLLPTTNGLAIEGRF
jgi:hypothetical protein